MMKVQRECKGHRGAVNCVRFTFDGIYVMSGSDDREIILWNPHKDDPSSTNQSLKVKSYSGVHGNPVLDLAIAPTNDRFISCGGDKTCFLWDVSTGVVVRRFQGHTQRINTVDINRDGTVFMSGSYDKTLCIWDLRSNNKDPIQTLTDFKDSVTCITHTKLVQGMLTIELYLSCYSFIQY
jgi:mitogen-activated protein kinase organizer 1